MHIYYKRERVEMCVRQAVVFQKVSATVKGLAVMTESLLPGP